MFHCDLASFHSIESVLFLQADLMGEVYFPVLASKSSGVTSPDLARSRTTSHGAYYIFKYTYVYVCQ